MFAVGAPATQKVKGKSKKPALGIQQPADKRNVLPGTQLFTVYFLLSALARCSAQFPDATS
jgi:hypothetical protein